MCNSELSLDWKQLADLPDAEGFAGSYAGVSNGALIVAGGANFPEKPLWEGGPKRWTDRVFVMTADSAGWLDATPLPKPLGYGATATLPQGMMIIGGSNVGGAVADCYMLTWDGKDVSYRTLPSLPVTLTGHAAAVMGGKVYVQGGSIAVGEQDAESRKWIYDPAADTWSEGEPLPGRGRSCTRWLSSATRSMCWAVSVSFPERMAARCARCSPRPGAIPRRPAGVV